MHWEIMGTRMEGRKIFESFRGKGKKKEPRKKNRRLKNMIQGWRNRKIITRGLRWFSTMRSSLSSREKYYPGKKISGKMSPKNLSRVQRAISFSKAFRIELFPSPLSLFFNPQFFNHENRNSPIVHVKIYSTQRVEGNVDSVAHIVTRNARCLVNSSRIGV